MFISQLIKTDVTAVKFVGEFIFVGIGNFLNVYDKNGDFITKDRIFDGHKVHGIESNDESVLLYGGRYLQTLKFDPVLPRFEKQHEGQATDWVLTSRWLRNQTIAAAVMLNRVIILNGDLSTRREVTCEARCILYSALISEKFGEMVVLSGTVFGEVLVWRIAEGVSECPVEYKLEGHKGVIFSISYNETSGYISSSSDDRSTILWSISRKSLHEELNLPRPRISLHKKIYGHNSRVFRSVVCEDFLITTGEDSYINIWNFSGYLSRKIEAHRGGPVWCLDYAKGLVVSGGGDCGVVMTPIETPILQSSINLPDNHIPKRIAVLASGNMIAVTDGGSLYHHANQKWTKISENTTFKNYNLLEISKCRHLFAIAGYHGEIHLYKEARNRVSSLTNFQTTRRSRIYSFRWLTCQTWLTCEEKKIYLYFLSGSREILEIAEFHLPKFGRENWITAGCQIGNSTFLVGDRRGNIYIYNLRQKAPLNIRHKVHNHLGVTQIINSDTNKIISLGRDSTLKVMTVSEGKLSLVSTDVLPFSWLTNLDGDVLTAFKGNSFTVFDYKLRKVLFQFACGGGHRSWDFHRDTTTTFAYVKDKSINVIKYGEDVYPKNIVCGFHSNSINSLRSVGFSLEHQNYLLVSGGEDTTLRFSRVGRDSFRSCSTFKTHLSSVRSIALRKLPDNNQILIFSGGGRGQILVWRRDTNDDSCRLVYSHYARSDEMLHESEVRVMALETMPRPQRGCYVFAALSDGNVAIFSAENDSFVFVKSITYKTKCLTEIKHIPVGDAHILVVASTDGILSFYDVTDLECRLIQRFQTHRSGIVAAAAAAAAFFTLSATTTALFLSGGDDGRVVLSSFEFSLSEDVSVKLTDSYVNPSVHCAQVTGAWLNDRCFLTSGVDQKVVLFKWRLQENRLHCDFIAKYDTAVADVQGIECVEHTDSVDVFIYGKGLEYLKCNFPL